ncbi:MAG TPA: MAPEG family protein [Stellaceae bacterium]|nr:MAPEG family protein [Stellaceae bacterium]
MTFAYWMILAAAFLPYLTVAIAKSAGIDNRAPRVSLDRLKGWRKRADWAHRNHFEAFAPFAAAVIVAELAHAPQSRIDLLAGAFILLRLIYTALYIANQAAWRSIVFTLGFLCIVALFVIGA